ncbi:MBL fold metallo-hydrolase [Gorillibacterium sp. sgz500922]|uniref:MBL fold metallo-hydrolase n=1 Tax=Gorillibacterium sp. sgz500922 TaxID=3446694 RepID=UPI003F66860E
MEGMTDRLHILGNGDSMGVPRVYCECAVCAEARDTGRNRRLRSAAYLETAAGGLWIDIGPDWAAQMEALGKRSMPVALLTHAHFDHMAGLPEWADCCRWTGERGLLYAPQEVLVQVRDRYPWLERQLTYQEADNGVRFGEWVIRTKKVCHGKNGYAYAYRFDKPGFAFVYCPDSINLGPEEKAFMTELDLLVIGTSYYKEEFDFHTRSVYDMTEALALAEEIRPRRLYFTHMSHGVDVRQAYPLPEHVQLTERGMQIPLRAEAAAARTEP